MAYVFYFALDSCTKCYTRWNGYDPMNFMLDPSDCFMMVGLRYDDFKP